MKIALVSCCKTKLPHSAMAQDLYIGDLFKKQRQYVEKRRRKEKPSRMNAIQLSMPDKLIDNLDVPLNADQTLYLLGHRHEKRTVLARKIGIAKVQLNHKLEKLDRTGSL